ncbi:uncharacterized protein LOC135203515 [Macrobrachium nipponense]|uniref:uncharacterized protein LOC135203515 n=1 Tax=Macrobrachium nipponense TaxID=159736 RepID=UPI0030C8A224
MQLAVKIQPKYRSNSKIQQPQQSRRSFAHGHQRSADDDDTGDDDDEYEDEEDDYYPNYYDEDGRIKNGNSTTFDGVMKPRGPYFASDNSSMRVYLGSTATLECTVLDLTNESVSWIRVVGDKLELLTWGSHKYTTDDRYTLVRKIGDTWQRWQLEIRDARVEDQGQYRCQISTQPPMLMSLTLDITEPVARVVDERGRDVVDKHYNSGSMIELKCIIEKVPFPHEIVTWRRGDTPLAFNTSRGGISVKGSKDSDYIRSRLYVANASPADSGVYSCWYSNYTSDNVTVHVIAGENSQAMQHDALPETPTTSGCFSSHLSRSSWIYLFLLGLLSSCYPASGSVSVDFDSHCCSCVQTVSLACTIISRVVKGAPRLFLMELKPQSFACLGTRLSPAPGHQRLRSNTSSACLER